MEKKVLTEQAPILWRCGGGNAGTLGNRSR